MLLLNLDNRVKTSPRNIPKPTQQIRLDEMVDITRDELHIEAAVIGAEGLKCNDQRVDKPDALDRSAEE
jgi:hypothetical protein